jgi:hypothetical protein
VTGGINIVMKKKITIAVALATVAVPAMAADAPAFAAASVGIETRYVRGAVTKERSDEFATVSVTPTEGRWGRYGFTVAVFNKSGAPVNIGAENVTATLPDGTVVGVLPAAEVVRIASSRARWNAALTALAASGGNYNSYSSSSYSSGHVGRVNYAGNSYSSGTAYNATAAALNRQRTDAQIGEIRAGLDNLISSVGENYFSTNTLNDGDGFAGMILVEKMKFKKAKGEKKPLRQIALTVNVAGRPYSFPFTFPK